MAVLEPRGRRRTAAGLCVLALLSAGCASNAGNDDRASDSVVAAGAGAPDAADEPAADGHYADPEAPAAYRPVVRDGKPGRATVAAAAGRFSRSAPVRYPDGVSVTVDSVTRRVEAAGGPGAFPGRKQTALTLTLTNGTARALDLTQVVVSTTYGARPRVAAPVYEHPSAADFSAVVPPGGSATATYVFAIPPGQARSAVTRVDFDGDHAAATFTGLEER